MPRLPISGADDGTWGDILNEFLEVSLDTDGTLKASAKSDKVAKAGDTMTGDLTLAGAPTSNLHAATKAYVDAEATLARNADNLTSGTVADARIASTIARDSEVTSAISAHESDTTNVHGIADTSLLETTSGSQAKVDAHVNDATDAHDASAVSFSPTGSVAATDVQAAIAELDGDISGKQASDSDLTAIAGLSPTDDDVIQRKSGAWTNRSMSQVKTDLALAKGDVGLGNVDNTSDAGKPVSTAQQTALDLKAPLASPTFTGVPVTPALSVTGLTGSVQAKRDVGATSSVAPTTGLHNTGDHVTTHTGRMFICTAGGTPGTWAEVTDNLPALTSGYGNVVRNPTATTVTLDDIWRTKTVNQYYYSSAGVTAATQVLTQDRVYFMPVLLPPGVIDRIGVDCVTGVPSLVCRLGIYSATGDFPFALIEEATSTGSLASSSTVVNLTISATIPDLAIYYLAVVCQGATPVAGSVRCTSSANSLVPTPLGTSTPTSISSANGARFSSGHSGALPTNPTISNTPLGEFMPRFHYRYSS